MPLPGMATRRLTIAAAVVAVVGCVSGALVGLFAPRVITIFYELEGPWVAVSYSPLAWGATRGSILGVAVGVEWFLLARRPGAGRRATLRWLLAVATAGVAVWACLMMRRCEDYQDRAWLQDNFADDAAFRALVLLNDYQRETVPDPQNPKLAARLMNLSNHYRELAQNYRRAARRPWLPVPPDPPMPE